MKSRTNNNGLRTTLAQYAMVVIAALAVAGITQAAGFVSFENGTTMVLWDDIHVTGGFKLSDVIAQGEENPAQGNVVVGGRNIYVGNVLGFCSEYTGILERCSLTLGDLGSGRLLQTNMIAHDQKITIQNAANSGITVSTISPAAGGQIDILGTVHNAGGNMISTASAVAVPGPDTVVADTFKTSRIINEGATLNLGGPRGVQIESEVFNVADAPYRFKLTQ